MRNNKRIFLSYLLLISGINTLKSIVCIETHVHSFVQIFNQIYTNAYGNEYFKYFMQRDKKETFSFQPLKTVLKHRTNFLNWIFFSQIEIKKSFQKNIIWIWIKMLIIFQCTFKGNKEHEIRKLV